MDECGECVGYWKSCATGPRCSQKETRIGSPPSLLYYSLDMLQKIRDRHEEKKLARAKAEKAKVRSSSANI